MNLRKLKKLKYTHRNKIALGRYYGCGSFRKMARRIRLLSSKLSVQSQEINKEWEHTLLDGLRLVGHPSNREIPNAKSVKAMLEANDILVKMTLR